MFRLTGPILAAEVATIKGENGRADQHYGKLTIFERDSKRNIDVWVPLPTTIKVSAEDVAALETTTFDYPVLVEARQNKDRQPVPGVKVSWPKGQAFNWDEAQLRAIA